MDKEVFLEEEYDDDIGGGYRRSQVLYDDDGELYSVYNLTDCPEDAIIDRCLFSAEDYVRALECGIRLGALGYTGVRIIER